MIPPPQVITLKNANGLEMNISNLGATILSLLVPDKNGIPVNVVVALPEAEDYYAKDYLDNYLYFGATVGRWAGRISGGQFKMNGKSFVLTKKDGFHLHGGKEGFDKKYWRIDGHTNSTLTLSYLSNHLEEGYPGNLQTSAHYELTDKNELKITYKATSDQMTPINLTNHSYFNLDGEGAILEHDLELKSDQYVELDSQLLVTGKIKDTKGTTRHFTTKSKIGKANFKGLDDVFVLKANKEYDALLSSSKTGIEMKVYTNQPVLVVYTPEQIPELKYKSDAKYKVYSSICFESESYPDAPNQPNFPSSFLNPGELYCNETVFAFRVK